MQEVANTHHHPVGREQEAAHEQRGPLIMLLALNYSKSGSVSKRAPKRPAPQPHPVGALKVAKIYLRASMVREIILREFPQVAPQGLWWQPSSQDSCEQTPLLRAQFVIPGQPPL